MTATATPRKSSARRTSPPASRRKARPSRTRKPRLPLTPKRGFREPNLETPAEVQEEKPFRTGARCATPARHRGNHPRRGQHRYQKGQRLIKPVKRTHKEVIINAESLETRVAVIEEGKLEEFTIERTTEERLVGSIFKGKVRNLEDGLKAAFVDIGFEKNAFLHYWDIVPSNFDSGVELVERENKKQRDKPRITQKDIPRLYPPGSEIIVQVTKGPIGTKGPRVTTNLVLPGRYLVLLAQLGPKRHFAQNREPAGAPASQANPARARHSRRHGRHHAHRGRRPAGPLFCARPRTAARRMEVHPGAHQVPSPPPPAFSRNPTSSSAPCATSSPRMSSASWWTAPRPTTACAK